VKHRIAIILFIIAFGLTFLLVENDTTVLLLAGGEAAIFLVLLMLGAVNIRWNWFLKSINYANSKKVCLTFDDGPDENTSRILDVLDQHNVKATFFVIGKKCRDNAAVLNRLAQSGHVIGNHSYSHQKHLAWVGTATFRDEILKTNAVVEEITKKRPKYFRPPFGVTNPKIARAIAQTKMKSVGWSLRSYDTFYTNVDRLSKMLKAKLSADGDIVLMHDTCSHSVPALNELITECKKRGMKFVTVEQLDQ